MSSQRSPTSTDSDKPLSPYQQRVVDHILTTGETVLQASDSLGIDVSNIYRLLRYPHVKKELHERTLEHIGILAPYAARVQQKLLTSDSDHVRANVAENILDRHLGKPVMRSQVAIQGAINVVIDLT
jgi:hypothetical protein